MKLATLVIRFQTRALPREEWNHAAHLGLALWTLRRRPFEAAMDELRFEIRAYNAAQGIVSGPSSGYHETITAFFARAVRQFLQQHPGNDDDEDALWAQLLETWGDKNVILAFYSRRALFATPARRELWPPDLQPLPFEP